MCIRDSSLPKQGLAFISLKNSHKDEGIGLAKELIKLKFSLCATKGTAEYIRKHGMRCKIINKVSSGSPHIVDVLDSKKIALVINTGGGNSEHRLNDAICLLYTSPSPRDVEESRMPSSA